MVSNKTTDAKLLALLRAKLGPGLELEHLALGLANQDEARDFAQSLSLTPQHEDYYVQVWERLNRQRHAANLRRKERKRAAKTSRPG